MRSIVAKLDTSVGASGPHDFAAASLVPRHRLRPSHPALHVRDDAYAPLVSARQDKESPISEKPKAKYFCVRGLDNPNHDEMPHEIGFLAHATLRDFCASARLRWSKIQVIWHNWSKSLDGAVTTASTDGLWRRWSSLTLPKPQYGPCCKSCGIIVTIARTHASRLMCALLCPL